MLSSIDHTPRAITLQNVVDRINNAVDELDADNAGRIIASISADGLGLHRLLAEVLNGGRKAPSGEQR